MQKKLSRIAEVKRNRRLW